MDLVERLAAIRGRGPCTDAERRACALLRDELRAAGREARIEPAWVRPQWATAWALHAALAVVGSLLSVSQPEIALALLAAVFASFALDLTNRAHLLRVPFPRRATQVVVSEPPRTRGAVRLVLAAHVDAPATGAIFKNFYVRTETWLRRLLRGHLASPPAALAFLVTVLAGLAGARMAGAEGTTLGAIQLVPTVLLLFAVGALLDIALSPPSPGANADASAVAAVLRIAEALDRIPPRHLDVEVVLAGAGDGRQLGMREYVRARRRDRRPEEVAVLALTACGAGHPRFFVTEGLLVPLRLHQRLIALARQAALSEQHLGAREARRSSSPAGPARAARWPALAIGCLDEHDRATGARQPGDTAARVGDTAIRGAVELALAVISRLDADLGSTNVQSESTTAESLRSEADGGAEERRRPLFHSRDSSTK
jgi:Peptidase family M28